MSNSPVPPAGGDEPDSVSKYMREFAANHRRSNAALQAIAFKLGALKEEIQQLITAISDGSFLERRYD